MGGSMQKIRAFALFGVVVVVLVIVAIANVNSSEAQNATAQTGSTSVPSVNSGPASQTESLPSPSVASGVAAIVPRASTDSALTISGAKFTSADATQYVSSHRVPHAQSSANPVVDAAVFITSQEASTRLQGETIGIPAGSLVCYVTFHGSFTVSAPPNKTVIYTKGVEVFNAQTGNLLLLSFLS